MQIRRQFCQQGSLSLFLFPPVSNYCFPLHTTNRTNQQLSQTHLSPTGLSGRSNHRPQGLGSRSTCCCCLTRRCHRSNWIWLYALFVGVAGFSDLSGGSFSDQVLVCACLCSMCVFFLGRSQIFLGCCSFGEGGGGGLQLSVRRWLPLKGKTKTQPHTKRLG